MSAGTGGAFCPECGAPAVFGELQGSNQAKHLRCGGCGAGWRVRRVQCHHCGNEDHRALGFLYQEGKEETERVEVCDLCMGYMKVITSFSPTHPEKLQAVDLATSYLDTIAREKGYSLPGGKD